MQVVSNIIKMYQSGLPAGGQVSHVEVLTASIRNVDQILYALQLKSDILTIPFKTFKEWAGQGFKQPSPEYKYFRLDLKPIPYDDNITLGKSWQEYDLRHDLTDIGLQRFWDDWKAIVS